MDDFFDSSFRWGTGTAGASVAEIALAIDSVKQGGGFFNTKMPAPMLATAGQLTNVLANWGLPYRTCSDTRKQMFHVDHLLDVAMALERALFSLKKTSLPTDWAMEIDADILLPRQADPEGRKLTQHSRRVWHERVAEHEMEVLWKTKRRGWISLRDEHPFGPVRWALVPFTREVYADATETKYVRASDGGGGAAGDQVADPQAVRRPAEIAEDAASRIQGRPGHGDPRPRDGILVHHANCHRCQGMTLAEARERIGGRVFYFSAYQRSVGRRMLLHPGSPAEAGFITTVNARYVFVRFDGEYSSKACEAYDLTLEV